MEKSSKTLADELATNPQYSSSFPGFCRLSNDGESTTATPRCLLEGEVDVRHQRRHVAEGVAHGVRQTRLRGDAHLATGRKQRRGIWCSSNVMR